MTHKECKGCAMLRLGFWCKFEGLPVGMIHHWLNGTRIPCDCPFKKYRDERK